MNFGNKNYISYKQQDVVQLGGNLNNHKHVKQIITGDAQLIGYLLSQDDKLKGLKQGIIVAGNSGRPGGSIGGFNSETGEMGDTFVPQELEKHYNGGQEEDILRTWLLANQSNQQNEFQKIAQCWGLDKPVTNQNQLITKQGYNYVNTEDSSAYSKPDHFVDDVKMGYWVTMPNRQSNPKINGTLSSEIFQTSLVFVSGPNASLPNPKHNTTSMYRTANIKARTDYNFFKEGIKFALKAGLDKLQENKVKIVILGAISTGIYAGKYNTSNTTGKVGKYYDNANLKYDENKDITKDFLGLVDEVLYADGNMYEFDYIIYPVLDTQMLDYDKRKKLVETAIDNMKQSYEGITEATRETNGLQKKYDTHKEESPDVDGFGGKYYDTNDPYYDGYPETSTASTTTTPSSSNRIPYPDYLIMSLKDLKEVFKLAQKYDLTTSSTNVNEEDKKLVTNLIQKYSSVYKLTEDGVNHLTISTPP